MTIIVWDGATLAADRRAVSGTLKRSMTKIFRHGDILFGGAGVWTTLEAMRSWVMGGCVFGEFPTLPKDDRDREVTSLWVVNRNGTILKFEDSPYPIRYNDPIFADGSGREFAYGAMAMGANALEAVQIACQYDIYCGGGVDTLSFPAN
jgi:ATP-dependent protease HslVU (ClpYQ) peptidase subunit